MIPTFQLIEETLEHIRGYSSTHPDPSSTVPDGEKTKKTLATHDTSSSSIVESISTLPSLVTERPVVVKDSRTSSAPPVVALASADEIARDVLRQLDRDIAQFRTGYPPGTTRSTQGVLAFTQDCRHRYIQQTLVRIRIFFPDAEKILTPTTDSRHYPRLRLSG